MLVHVLDCLATHGCSLRILGHPGIYLLRKMGWRPGKRLKTNKERTLGFWQFEAEVDKRYHVLEQRIKQKVKKPRKPLVTLNKYLREKHPVSLLGEYCSKHRLHAPMYELCFECGLDHTKNFLFKVTVNDVEFKPSVPSPSKKKAKALAAHTCLQVLGILPKPNSKTIKKL